MKLKVNDYMTAKVITISPDTGARQAFFKMKENGIRHLPIVDEKRKLMGIVSDRELRRPNWADETQEIGHSYYLDDVMLVRDLMVTEVKVLHTYDSLKKAVDLLLTHNIGAAPVLDKLGDLVGMLSAVDLLRALKDLIDQQKD